jgi:hypothetical protein
MSLGGHNGLKSGGHTEAVAFCCFWPIGVEIGMVLLRRCSGPSGHDQFMSHTAWIAASLRVGIHKLTVFAAKPAHAFDAVRASHDAEMRKRDVRAGLAICRCR